MNRNLRKIISILILLLGILAITSVYIQLKIPQPTGPYNVGRMLFRWKAVSRPEVLTSSPDDSREVIVIVWYPAQEGTGTPAPYFPDLRNVSSGLIKSEELFAFEVFGLPYVRSNSLLHAELSKDKSSYPILFLSPGNGTNVEFYSAIAEDLASHGYVVVGINHPYDVAAVQLSDGRVAVFNKDQWKLPVEAHQAYIAERLDVRTADVLSALDQLEILNSDVKSVFAGRLDFEHIGILGHSLGGINASLICTADPRFLACLNFDGLQKGGPFSADENAVPPPQPFMFMTKESSLHPKIIDMFRATSSVNYWVVIQGASHDSFTDGSLLQPSLLPFPNKSDAIMTLIRKYTLAFFDQTLKMRPNDILSNSVSKPDVSLEIFKSP